MSEYDSGKADQKEIIEKAKKVYETRAEKDTKSDAKTDEKNQIEKEAKKYAEDNKMDLFAARQFVEKSHEAVKDKEDQLKMDKMSKKEAEKYAEKRQKEKRADEKEKENKKDEEMHEAKLKEEKKLAAAQKHGKKSHHKKKKHFKIEDDPSDKIEETLTERAVIHKAVTKIDNNDGEDLINNFITESDSTAPTTNSWLSNPAADGQQEDVSSTGSVASAANNLDITVDENNKQDPLFLTKNTLGIWSIFRSKLWSKLVVSQSII